MKSLVQMNESLQGIWSPHSHSGPHGFHSSTHGLHGHCTDHWEVENLLLNKCFGSLTSINHMALLNARDLGNGNQHRDKAVSRTFLCPPHPWPQDPQNP